MTADASSDELPRHPAESTALTSSSAVSVDELRTLPGVGPKVLQTLRTHGYQTIDEVEAASPETLTELPNIGVALSQRLSKATTHSERGDTGTQRSNDSLNELKLIPGVGDKIISTLRDRGYQSPEAVAASSISELTDLPNIGETVATRLVQTSNQ